MASFLAEMVFDVLREKCSQSGESEQSCDGREEIEHVDFVLQQPSQALLGVGQVSSPSFVSLLVLFCKNFEIISFKICL